MTIPESTLKRIEPYTPRKPFNCGNNKGGQDLNDFFHNDSKGHSEQLLAVTYAIESETETIAYYCVSNDSIRKSDAPKKSRFMNIISKLPNTKRYQSHPAVKIGRFAVSRNHQRNKIGTEIMDYIKGNFIINNKTGCKFITVDAYKDAIPFYLKNGFEFLTDDDSKDDNRLMYFDLYPLSRDLLKK